jgi:hypothetical protein
MFIRMNRIFFKTVQNKWQNYCTIPIEFKCLIHTSGGRISVLFNLIAKQFFLIYSSPNSIYMLPLFRNISKHFQIICKHPHVHTFVTIVINAITCRHNGPSHQENVTSEIFPTSWADRRLSNIGTAFGVKILYYATLMHVIPFLGY